VKFEATRTSDGIGGLPPAFYRVAETYFTDKAAMNAAAQTPEWAGVPRPAAQHTLRTRRST